MRDQSQDAPTAKEGLERQAQEAGMNRIVSVLVAIAVVLVLLPGTARADHGMESVNGGLRLEGTFFPPGFPVITITGHLAVSAQDASSGASGSVQIFQRQDLSGMVARFKGEVDCLAVTASAAVLSGDITSSSGLNPVFTQFQVAVVDGGNPVGGMSADSAVVSIFTEGSTTDPITCLMSGSGVILLLPPDRGNIIVHDDV